MKKFTQSWQAALTIIHEFSHLALGTEDHRYGYRGLKPGKKLNEAHAITNADSWAFFTADLAGILSEADFNQIFRESTKQIV